MPRWAKIALTIGAVVLIGAYGLSVYHLHHPDCPPKSQLNERYAAAQGAEANKILNCFAHYEINPPIDGTPQGQHF